MHCNYICAPRVIKNNNNNNNIACDEAMKEFWPICLQKTLSWSGLRRFWAWIVHLRCCFSSLVWINLCHSKTIIVNLLDEEVDILVILESFPCHLINATLQLSASRFFSVHRREQNSLFHLLYYSLFSRSWSDASHQPLLCVTPAMVLFSWNAV